MPEGKTLHQERKKRPSPNDLFWILAAFLMESLFQPNNIYVPYSDEEDVLYQFCDPNTSDEAFEESYTQFSRKKTSRVTHAK